MALSTQSNFDKIASPDAHAVGIDGGLNLKSDKSRLAPPSTTRADNASYFSPGTVQQLPAFSSSMPAGVQHIYNLHARDTYAPSVTGDVMVHGEVLDSNGASTSPLWLHAQGTAKNDAQPIPPFSLRTRVIANKLQQSYYGGTSVPFTDATGHVDLCNPMLVRQESGTAATRRFALGTCDSNGSINVVLGLCDGMQETGETVSLVLSGPGISWCEMVAIQGTDNWALVYAFRNTVARRIYDFYGKEVGSVVNLTTTCLAVDPSGQTCIPVTTFNHCGTTYVGVIGNASPFNVFATPVNGTPMLQKVGSFSASNTPFGAFAISSPTTHQPLGSRSYLAVTYNGSTAVVTNPFTGTSYTSAGIALGTGSTPGYWNTLATSAVSIADGSNGMQPTSKLVVTTFYHNVMSAQATATGSQGYQAVGVQTAIFTGAAAGAGAIYTASGGAFEAPSGVALATKAFVARPPESGFAGAQNAVQAYVAVRIGAAELDTLSSGINATTYGQPTYFLLDHQARVVGRWCEGIGPVGIGGLVNGPNGQGGTGPVMSIFPPYSLGAPLIGDGASTDTSCLDVQLPGWAQTTISNPAGPPNFPRQLVFTPMLAHLSLSSSASHVPAVQGGPYTVLSGPMTCVHDGRSVTEAGYHTAAFNISVGPPSTPGPTLGTAGKYSYAALWLWTDNNGRIHRSSPSAVATYTPANGAAFTGASIVAYPPITNKAIIGGSVTLKIYRASAASPGVFFEVGSQLVKAFGILGNYAVSFLDNVYLDGSLPNQPGAYASGQASLYLALDATTNAPLTAPPTPPPSFLWQSSTKGRAFGLAQVLGQFRVYYSSFISSALPFEWNANNYVAIPPDMGDVRSIETIDDKVFVLATRTNGVFSGDGPDNGVVAPPGAGFSAVTPVPTPSGVLGTGSPGRTPDGIVFQGGQGIQQIGRDGTITPIGAQVEPITGRQAYNRGVPLGRATTLPLIQSVVWANPQGPALVYNYLAGKWSSWPLLAGANAIAQRMDQTAVVSLQPVSSGKLAGPATAATPGCDMGQLGSVYKPIFTGLGSSATLVMETPWLLPSAESGGEGILWDAMVTGDWLGPHVLQVEQAYNYATTYNPPSQLSWPTAPVQYAYRVRPLQTSRVWAVRYRISLLPLATLQAGYAMANLNDLVVNYGARQGTTRTGAAQSG